MKILFCGSYMPPDQITHFQYSSEAGNNFQHNLVRNLEKNNSVEILSYIGFPMEKGLAKKLAEELKRGGIHYILRCGMFSRIFNYIWYYLKFLKLVRQCDIILLYNYYYINFFILPIAKLFNKRTALIIADHTERQEYGSFIRKNLAIKAERDYLKFSSLIILSKELYKKIEHKHKLFFPGAINYTSFENFSLKSNKKMQVLYSGLLNDVTGIDLLLEAIRKISCDNIEFIFTGRGAMQSDVENLSKEDKRVVYKGFVSRNEYYQLLDSVDLVVNPRNMNLQQNQNNFPSKIMEYLASGRIIVSTYFAGYQDFEGYIEFVDSTADGLAKKTEQLMVYFFQNIELEKRFEKNRLMAKNYDWGSQVKRLEDFI